jgi:hypothetical protein
MVLDLTAREAGVEATGEGVGGRWMTFGPSSYLSRSSLDRILRGVVGSRLSFLILVALESRMPLFRPKAPCSRRTRKHGRMKAQLGEP